MELTYTHQKIPIDQKIGGQMDWTVTRAIRVYDTESVLANLETENDL